MKKKISKIKEIWYSYYQCIIPLICTIGISVIAFKFKIYPWTGTAYVDMLTALITFQSIIISVFGVLIPALITSREEKGLVNFFYENADTDEFVKRVKKTIGSGVVDILLVCMLYAYDILPIKIYVIMGMICVFVLLYFLCSSYRYIGILLKLLMTNKKPYEGKRYNKQLSKDNMEKLNRMLEKDNKE